MKKNCVFNVRFVYALQCKRLSFILLMALSLVGCKSAKISKQLQKAMTSNFDGKQFTGFMVYNPRTQDTIFKHQAEHYFTPASNTKIFTLYTGLQLLPDHVPAFKYTAHSDTLIVRSTGDPSFLHPYFKDSTALNFMKNYKEIRLITDNYKNDKFGPGWSWDDYPYYYSPERSAFPMYGNVVTLSNSGGLAAYPQVLAAQTSYTKLDKRRDYNVNRFYFKPSRQDTITVPLLFDTALQQQLWDDLLPNRVQFVPGTGIKTEHVLYSIPTDSLFKRMMLVSDNLLAEQILILASSTVSDTLDADPIRKSILENQLNFLKQPPKWRDGSGLSTYNLMTPMSIVQVLEKLYREVPRERLFGFFPAGGKRGTIANWYAGQEKPYVYAKTGTLSGVHCLSGYLVTNSGETLIFSFMHNNFVASSTPIKQDMQKLLEYLRDSY